MVFRPRRERTIFEKLMTISGIGPKLAVTILSGGSVEELVGAIKRSDLARLTAIPGVGKKTAERIVLELKDKLQEFAEAVQKPGVETDVLSALENLGYSRALVESALQRAANGDRDPAFDVFSNGAPDFDEGMKALKNNMEDRVIAGSMIEEEAPFELSLRPRRSRGVHRPARRQRQPRCRDPGRTKTRRTARSHFVYGPPGLGKTTLASVIANEMGARFRATAGPLIQLKGDLTAILTNLEFGDVLFIDEIHRLQPNIEEILYPAMEDYKLDIIIGQGPSARTHRLDLRRFTLIGATTRAGLITAPLRSRFGMVYRLDFLYRAGAGVHHQAIGGDSQCANHCRRLPRNRQTMPRNAARRKPAAEANSRLRSSQRVPAKSRPRLREMR